MRVREVALVKGRTGEKCPSLDQAISRQGAGDRLDVRVIFGLSEPFLWGNWRKSLKKSDQFLRKRLSAVDSRHVSWEKLTPKAVRDPKRRFL